MQQNKHSSVHLNVEHAFAEGLLNPSAAVPEGVLGRDGEVSAKRYGVYRNNVVSSLVGALAANFPAIQRLLGADYFKALAAEFIRHHPPVQPVLSEYGGGFADFIQSFPPLASYPYLADVARIEWAWLSAYHSADAPILDAQKLASVSPEDMPRVVLVPHPSASLHFSEFPAASIFLQNREFAQMENSEQRPQAVVVCRPEVAVNIAWIEPADFTFASALFEARTLGEAATLAASGGGGFDLNRALQALLAAQVFQDLEIRK
ncbi:HvfC/BufC N-terminal domain-containing protein [Pseudovibrio flavus]|uniref:HvfC/BufC N-terminal domain-containing protein n=1 Tax=Pseudovibrio flavus TaxID=2529854 RepID=UPI00211CFF3C|nr:DNA-binding domain-containing protein [Pseudovibrio flavus]